MYTLFCYSLSQNVVVVYIVLLFSCTDVVVVYIIWCSFAQSEVVVYLVLLFSCTECGCCIHYFAILMHIMRLLYTLFGVLLHRMKLLYTLFCCYLAHNVVVVYIVLLFSCTKCGCCIHYLVFSFTE